MNSKYGSGYESLALDHLARDSRSRLRLGQHGLQPAFPPLPLRRRTRRTARWVKPHVACGTSHAERPLGLFLRPQPNADFLEPSSALSPDYTLEVRACNLGRRMVRDVRAKLRGLGAGAAEMARRPSFGGGQCSAVASKAPWLAQDPAHRPAIFGRFEGGHRAAAAIKPRPGQAGAALTIY